MPTENRSSNTEMVSVPSETIEQAEKLPQEDNCCTMAREFRTILAKPVDQRQGEPVAYADPRSFENLKSFGRLGGIYQHEWMWAEPEPGMVPLYTHADAGEVERLHKIAYDTQAALIAANRQIKMLEGELDTLRAQLAERDALLRESYAELLAIKAEIGFRGATIALIGRIDATLSVSADPESKS
ncbi:hypothetical protein HU761_26090 [Pseudomonas sp. SWRI59]|uniref:hypothetical protein n=1 Tax=unclassified Pseudomonas TaxID=196821 RepID=UPI0016448D92|nr:MULTISPECIES: hypothetical protein [unclassified Pseudomonas]MBC3504854.1 hypothetical protein [Pseudomonas sp. SWRI59]MBC3510104.1 hypothetical protein [Pseudomonas sp. SWRI68]